MKKALVYTVILTLFSGYAMAAESPLDTIAKQAFMMDFDTGAVLLDKNGDERMPTSSMSKVMTMYVVFDALKKGKLGLEDTLPVSEKAWRMQGSKMFVEVGKQVKIEDLIRGVIIQSGNDATIVLAEGVAGSEESFAAALNETAKELGMAHSHFMNASGWPDPQHYSTARDLAILGRALIRDFPNEYPYYSETEFTFNAIKQQNRNPLLYKNIGADGIKTGHTEVAGYGLIGSGLADNRRVIFVINGLPDEQARAQEAARILEWGLKRFENKKLFEANAPILEAPVAEGTLARIPLVVKEPVLVTLPKIGMKETKIQARFMQPVLAPVTMGAALGKLEISIPGQASFTVPLLAGADVPRAGIFSRIITRGKALLGLGQVEN
ncbi:MAG: D-alanyl-D-alanine carboxypeptidase [Alphaproteobacteria bacterium]|nr:D-alanyl-D-alanine carboxypeptidase [Alphaproteobacteria bacterium]